MTGVNIIKGLGPVLQIAEGWSVELPKDVHDILNKRTNSTWPTTAFAPRLTGKGPFTMLFGNGKLGADHLGSDHRPRWRSFYHSRLHAAYPGMYAQR